MEEQRISKPANKAERLMMNKGTANGINFKVENLNFFLTLLMFLAKLRK